MANGGMIPSMIGRSPYEADREQFRSSQQDALELAKLDPLSASKYMMGMAGAGFARPVANMLGLENPDVSEAEQVSFIQREIDHSTPEGLLKGAERFNSVGNTKMAVAYTQAAQMRQDQLVKNKLTAAKTDNELKIPGWKHDEKMQSLENTAAIREASAANTAQSIAARAQAAKDRNALMERMNNADNDRMTQLEEMRIGAKKEAEKQKLSGKLEVDWAKRNTRIEAMDGLSSEVFGKIKSLVKEPGFSNLVHPIEQGYKYAPGDTQRANDLLSEIQQTLKKVGVSDIKTLLGGSVGTMTLQEWPIAADSIANVKAGRGAKFTVRQLNKVAEHLVNGVNDEIDRYNEHFGKTKGFKERVVWEPITEADIGASRNDPAVLSSPPMGKVRNFRPKGE